MNGTKTSISSIDLRAWLGSAKRIGATDADVERDKIALRSRSMKGLSFAAWDRTFANDSRGALWTEDDDFTRLNDLRITALPWSERP
jgi:hypothetical protein